MTENNPLDEIDMISESEKSGLIWAMSPRGKYVHAYPNAKALENGVPLCGVICKPTQVLEHFDLSNEVIHDVACPDCLARLALARYVKPISELYKERKAAEQVCRS